MRIIGWGKPLALQDIETPKATGKKALVKVSACGVCHTDVHVVSGAYDLGRERKLTMTDRGIDLPITPGHEIAGIVESLGQDAKDDGRKIKEGDPVIVYPWLGCGYCRTCRSGMEHLCETKARTLGIFQDGGYAEYVLVPDIRYLVDLGKVDPSQAAPLACSGITTYSAVKKCRLGPDDLLVIVGAGGLGTTAIQIAKKTTDARLIVMDVDDSKLGLARDLGADHCINTKGLETKQLASKIKEINDGVGADAVIDFVGSPATSSFGFEALAKRGRLVLVGLFGGEGNFPLPLFPLRGIEVLGNFTGSLQDLAEMVQLARRGAVRPVISETHALADANEVLQELIEGKIKGRALVRP